MLKFGERNSSYPEFKKNLPFTDCRYCVFDQDYESPDGRKVSRIWFISWFPKNATPYNKVAYASGKIKFGEMLPGAFDCQVSRYITPPPVGLSSFQTCYYINLVLRSLIASSWESKPMRMVMTTIYFD